jgi:integrase
MGLGSRDTVSLGDARDKASTARKIAKSGVSPVEEKRQAKKVATRPTFGQVADALIAGKESAWRNARHRQQWRVTLTTYGAPLYPFPVDQVDTAAVLAVLTPLWQRAPETASRLRGRIEAVLDAAKAQGYRSGENPAQWKGNLAHLLAKRGILTRGHHAALPYQDVPAFIAKLREEHAIQARALEFCILTATRSGEVFGAQWGEIDLDAKVWTIPGGRMKSAREHRVPLCDRALEIVQKMEEARTGDLVFPGQRRGRPFGSNAMSGVLRRLGVKDATVHGFRSAFRDWCGNETHFRREIAEAALAHTTGDQTERAYRRSDALEKRRALMDAWAAYCEPATAANNVVRLR